MNSGLQYADERSQCGLTARPADDGFNTDLARIDRMGGLQAGTPQSRTGQSQAVMYTTLNDVDYKNKLTEAVELIMYAMTPVDDAMRRAAANRARTQKRESNGDFLPINAQPERESDEW